MTIDPGSFVLFVLALVIIFTKQELRIRNLERAVKWFATHLRIDDRDLEKSPPPDSLAALIENLDDPE